MAGDTPSLSTLEKPVKANEILKQEQRDYDCTPCRLVGKSPHSPQSVIGNFGLLTLTISGGTAFIGLAGYSYWEGMRQLEQNRMEIIKSKSMIGMRPRKFGIAGLSFGLFWMGIYRLFG